MKTFSKGVVDLLIIGIGLFVLLGIVIVLIDLFNKSSTINKSVVTSELKNGVEQLTVTVTGTIGKDRMQGNVSNKCKIDRYSNDLEDFLSTYTVQSGDSLLTIARDQLGDVSRVNELISLNKDRYPSLSIDNPFIEIGWKLYLPPDYTKQTSGRLSRVGGWISNIVSNDPLIFEVNNNLGSHFATITISDDTIVPNSFSSAIGECVYVIQDELSGKSYKLFLQ
jgi:LysM repeat protein